MFIIMLIISLRLPYRHVDASPSSPRHLQLNFDCRRYVKMDLKGVAAGLRTGFSAGAG